MFPRKTDRWLMLTLFVLLPTALLAQNSSVTGSVHDEQSGEEIIGANVVVVGTTLGATTDIDGKFFIKNMPAGACDIRISFIGYGPKTISGVVVKENETLTLNVNIAQTIVQAEEVTVTAERVLSTESALLSERRKAASIGDGVSAEQIKKSPDATSSDALKRVTGISIVDNKFVYIRGITERYNGTTLDGASVTSTEAGKKAFSFDMLPANLIENTTVVKSATPDLPGDFTGGLVQLNTLDFPDRRLTKLTISSSYNSVTTSENILVSQGNRGFLGFDDGGRKFPGENPDPTKLAQSMSNTWAHRNATAPYNNSFSLAIGDRLILDDDNASSGQLGFIGAASYKRSYQRSERTVSDFDNDRLTTGPKDEFSLLWGGIANLSYKFSGLHKISFKNNYNHSATDEVSQLRILDNNTTLDNSFTTIAYTQRSVYTGQLLGEHTLPALGDLTIHWRGSASSSFREDPDRKEVDYTRSMEDTTQPYEVGYNKRSWSRLNDKTLGGVIDFSLPMPGAGKLKFGASTEGKTANYEIRYFSGGPDFGAPVSLKRLSLETIYEPQNFGLGKFLFHETTIASDFYSGDQSLHAGYFMADQPFEIFGNNFRFTGGVRLENFRQNVGIPKSRYSGVSGDSTFNELKTIDALPSMNLTYLITDNMNLRLAYSHSVNRPEFRERAEVSYEDFVLKQLVRGNPNLKRAYIHNYDVRYEFFPSAGEVLAISYFEKYISNAIEQIVDASGGTKTRTYFNAETVAKNSGFELEFRKTLGFLGEYWNNILIGGNYTRVQSRVPYSYNTTGSGGSATTYTFHGTRPMQGQSPYMINFSIQFTEPNLGTSISILYNKFGSRLDAVGGNDIIDIYEEPRDLVDLAITQPLFGGLEGKFTVKNLNGKDRVLTQGGLPYERTSTGTTFGLQLSMAL